MLVPKFRREFEFRVVILDKVDDEGSFFLLMRSSDFWKEVRKHIEFFNVKNYVKVNFYEYKNLSSALELGYTQLVIDRDLRGFTTDLCTFENLLFRIFENEILLTVLVKKSGNIPLQSRIMGELIRHDALDVIVKMLSVGYELNPENYKLAILEGSIEVLSTLLEWEPPKPIMIRHAINTAILRNREIVHYLVSRWPHFFTTENIEYAAKLKNYSLVSRIHSQNIFTFESCVIVGDERLLSLRPKSCDVVFELEQILENHGNIDVIRFADKFGMLSCDESSMNKSLEKRYVEVVKFLHTKKGFKCSMDDLTMAISNNDINMVDCIIEIMGFESNYKLGCVAVEKGCNLEMIEFLHGKDCLMVHERLLKSAKLHCGKDVVEFLEMLDSCREYEQFDDGVGLFELDEEL